ncbi:CPBP family intramembrane glutamic endopeptidase [Virgibacillus ihumii]|uniref:CPBP family intramembrane glutamic endopeptidase n=1 Tax=Virgibacillus ihumii TaxID=2686091 RepID=UPI00157DDCAE|nr:CPBP family intramembrane glutamic endopeptidase [Virgibacillus ihumii]
MTRQSEIIKQLSDAELNKQLVLSQLIMLVTGLFLSIFLFDDFSVWFELFELNITEILYYGVCSGLLIVIVDLLLIKIFPKRYYDDDGINARIFGNRKITETFALTLLVAISEEILFRGFIQTTFGYLIASILFALIHFRYLRKPVLLISVLAVSFYLGYIFLLTQNLLVTIISHFIVDFTLGIAIRFQKWGAEDEL